MSGLWSSRTCTGQRSANIPVRHGNRLDAADKKWHLSSPTPYDPPLTYGGLLQARQVGHQIASILEQTRADEQPRRAGENKPKRRKRYRVVVHSSPFLRCIQTSVGLSSGLAQSSADFSLDPFELIAPPLTPSPQDKDSTKSTILRIDSFLGEWLSPEYFEMITPPPSSSLMLGTAKADLLRREDYSKHTHLTKEPPAPAVQPDPRTNGALWNGSPTQSPSPGRSRQSSAPDVDNKSFNTTALATALEGEVRPRRGYIPPRPSYAASSAGKIPDGIVADARDECVVIDYQWDSMREPLAFGDGGTFGEEWSSMHKRFRGGVEKLIKWYWDNETPEKPVSQGAADAGFMTVDQEGEEDIETVVVIVSHGAGCNALIGAITHQPVLMDVGIASITMASRKGGIEAHTTQKTNPEDSGGESELRVDHVYDIRLSASTEHLHSTNSTPVSARRASGPSGMGNQVPVSGGVRGRTSTYSSGGGPIMNQFTFTDPLSLPGSRSTSASAAVGVGAAFRRDAAPGPTPRPTGRASALSSIGYGSIAGSGNGNPGGPSPSNSAPSQGLWTPQPSSLRLMDDGKDDEEADEFDDMLPNLDQKKFISNPGTANHSRNNSKTEPVVPATLGKPGRGPVLAAPIKLNTNLSETEKPAELVTPEQLGGGAGGLWGLPPPPDEAERFRDMSQTKRRWTVNERPL